MSFQITPGRSSRVKNSRKSTASSLGLRRSTSSPSSSPRVRKTSSASRPTLSQGNTEELALDDTGAIVSLAVNFHFRDVRECVQHIRTAMFEDIPESGAGMNSTRIAEVLNFRKNLPPIVTVAHVDALSRSSTRTEREINELAQAGVLRRVILPHRGGGAADIGDGLALVEEWDKLVLSHPDLDEGVKSKYLSLIHGNPTSATISGDSFTAPELKTLMASGFLTTPTGGSSVSSLFASPGAGTLSGLSTAGSRHAAGSLAAVGGAQAAHHISGGRPSWKPGSSLYTFSLPNTGSHIKLVTDARNHFLSLLKKSKYKQAPLDVLRERWDGGVPGSDEQTRAKRVRGEFAGVLPGRTKKWKQFFGMKFEWILEECVGAGLVECFETGSVGLGVRLLAR
ncbi:uncharacterized protein EI97DRAFT_409556 [Westerdykella ornata]|uniref:Serine-threonine protein kinase 19 n=1 Tax=Westerdykella ornata TaxID=318751 RepID=A0A6A6JWS4_WESOR|nr:uncharacterized protein EI97DRAFT_409556 [Westerdykella ornata]KAF2281060.1 hypothetical protein EI97DRAFT_409556 [Westerdykella ornata]